MVYAQHNICPGEWHTQTHLAFWHTNGSPNLGHTTWPHIIMQKRKKEKKRTCKIVDLAVLDDHWIKLKEKEKKDKYLDLARELKKKSCIMKVTIIPIVIGALGTVSNGLLKGLGVLEIRGRVETIQTTALLR